MCGCFLCTPYWGPGPQLRHVPWLGINRWPFGLQAGIQSTEPHQPEQIISFLGVYLFILERGEGRERGRDTSMCERYIVQIGCLSHAPNWGPGLQPRHIPWPGIEPVTFGFIGCQSTEPHQPGPNYKLLEVRDYILFVFVSIWAPRPVPCT